MRRDPLIEKWRTEREQAKIKALEQAKKDYFFGYSDPWQYHPWMPATGSEGRCLLCDGPASALVHQEAA